MTTTTSTCSLSPPLPLLGLLLLSGRQHAVGNALPLKRYLAFERMRASATTTEVSHTQSRCHALSRAHSRSLVLLPLPARTAQQLHSSHTLHVHCQSAVCSCSLILVAGKLENWFPAAIRRCCCCCLSCRRCRRRCCLCCRCCSTAAATFPHNFQR